MRRIIVAFVAMFAIGFVVSAVAQEKPKPEATKVEAAKPPAVPTVTDQEQAAFATLQFTAQVRAQDVAVLQKELDSTNAEIGRLIEKLRREGYDLTQDPQTRRLIYVPKAEPKK